MEYYYYYSTDSNKWNAAATARTSSATRTAITGYISSIIMYEQKLYKHLYNTMENTANQNAGNQLHVRQYSTHSSHHALQPYNLLYIFYGMR